MPAIVGAGAAAEIAHRELSQRIAHTAQLQAKLWKGLKISHVKLNGPEPGPHRISTNLNLSIEFTEGEGLVLLCDMNGIAIAAGSSCVSKSLKISHVLSAIGLTPALSQGSITFSLGMQNTPDDIDYVIETLPKFVDKLRNMSPLWTSLESTQPEP